MDEAVDRFTPYEDSGVPSFLEESATFGFDPVDASTASASASAAATAGANTEIMSTHIDPVSGPTQQWEWFWYGPADNPRKQGSSRLWLLLLGMCPHALASALFVHRGEKARVSAHPEVLLSERRLLSLLLPVVMAMSPLVEEGRKEYTTCKTTTTPLWRGDQQDQLCNA